MQTKHWLNITVALCLVLSGITHAKELPLAAPEDVGACSEKIALVKPAVQKFVDDEKIAGAAVMVARKGKIIFSETFGMMDRKANKPMQQDTIYRIYSMSKPITSVAVMMLHDEGKLKLDAPAAGYIREFKKLKVYVDEGKNEKPARKMTVRDLLRHTSGLTYGFFGNTPIDKMYISANVLDRDGSLREMAEKLGKIPLQYHPGTKWHYGVSTDVLGCLVEKVSGQSLDEFFKQRIFEPLDMKDTAFYVPADKAARFASCYGPKGGGGLKVSDAAAESKFLKDPGLYSGGGGLVSTARDYMRFCQMLLNKGQLDGKRLLKAETVEMMTCNQLPDSVKRGADGGFGLGFSVKLTDGKVPRGEYGWGGAASTHFWISPEHELIGIALSQYMPFSARLENTVKPLIYDSILAENRQIDVSNIPKPTAAQLAWQQAQLGVLVSYDLHTFNEGRYVQPKARITPIKDIDQFNPTQLNTDQWIRTAKKMGARFAILTASHESGFRLWRSDANPYSLKSVKWGDGKRDIVREFIDSCRKYDVKPGIYMGTRWNSRLGVYNYKVTKRSTITQDQYNALIEKEVEEICSRYGDLFEIWFDGGAYGPKEGGPDVLSVFEKYQPNCLFYHNYQRADARWGGSESGTVPYPCWATMPFNGYEGHKKASHANGRRLLKHGDPEGKFWCPAMSDAPLRNHEWFWEEGDERKIYPLKALINMYYNSVGRNSTLIIGLTPDTRGLIPDADAERCRQFGQAIRNIFSNRIADTSGRGDTLELTLPANSQFDHIVIEEDIRHGERVRRFTVEYNSAGKWTELTTGSCIGHKRILRFKSVTADKLRLTVSEAIAEPVIKKLAVYNSILTENTE